MVRSLMGFEMLDVGEKKRKGREGKGEKGEERNEKGAE